MLSTSVSGVNLDCCIFNASGPRCGSVEALTRLAKSRAGAALSKSATLTKRDGNAMPRFVNNVYLGPSTCDGAINSEGLPNYGFEYSEGKPYFVSLSGMSLEDNLTMLDKVLDCEGVSAVEINLACPNLSGKSIISCDFEAMDATLKALTANPKFEKLPVGVKLTPYFTPHQFTTAAAVLAKYPVKFVTTCNTIPNGLFVDVENECEAIAPNHGLGGLSGGFIKHTALANVRELSRALKAVGREDIDIIGVGGVSSGQDVFELILCGAKAVQTATCYWSEGPKCFERLSGELEKIMREKGYTSIEQFRGKLKPFAKPSAGVAGGSKKARPAGVGNTVEHDDADDGGQARSGGGRVGTATASTSASAGGGVPVMAVTAAVLVVVVGLVVALLKETGVLEEWLQH